jgi:hypothetical protein
MSKPPSVKDRPIVISQWLGTPDSIVRRWEAWEVALAAAEYQRLGRIRRHWWTRWLWRLKILR